MTGMASQRRFRRRPSTRLVLAVATAAVVLCATPAPTDEASDSLARYDKPLDMAIDRALAFLAKNQTKDGSFFSKGYRGSTAVTSVSVMAFLAKGHTPGVGPYGEIINRGIDYVLSQQRKNGMLIGPGGRMYSHGISTLMLSEASGMVDAERQKRLEKALGKALQLILSAQKIPKSGVHIGGWRYMPHSRDSDISCSGWQLMSLRSARNNGTTVPKEAIDKAVKYIFALRCSDGGFGYNGPGGPGLARTGTALLCLELCGQHGHKATVAAGEWILKRLPKKYGQGHFFYGLYYCSQGMFQLGGKYWQVWAQYMYETMLKLQKKDGSWPVGGGNSAKAGACYCTAMSVLAMSVSYRQLPIYQR